MNKKYDFFGDDDDKKYFPVDILVKIGDDFPGSYDDGDGDILVKKESDNEMDNRETTPFVSPKRENDIDDRETILYTSPRRESVDEIFEKIYEEPKLETPAETEQQVKINDRNFIKSELKRNKVDLKLSKAAELNCRSFAGRFRRG